MATKKEKIKRKKTTSRNIASKVTVKQRRAAKALVENGSKSMAQAMREAGYSEATIKAPSKVTRSKGWQELMDEYFPQDYVAEKHKELFEAEDVTFFRKGNGKIQRELKPDYRARKAAIDMAHKLRGNYAPEKVELSKRKFQDMSDKELAENIAAMKKQLLKK